jgi:hypothetical protein
MKLLIVKFSPFPCHLVPLRLKYSLLRDNLTQYCSGDNIVKNVLGGAYSYYGGEKRRLQSFWWRNMRERGPRRIWEDNIKMDLQQVECGGVDWIEAAQDRARWRALVNAVMNLWVP